MAKKLKTPKVAEGFPREPGVVITADEMKAIAAGELPKPKRKRAPSKKSAAAFSGAPTAPAPEAEQLPEPPAPPAPSPPPTVKAVDVFARAGLEADPEADPEIINGCDVAKVAAENADVMLEVACSPVIPMRGSTRTNEPCLIGCEAYELDGGKYRVLLPARFEQFAVFHQTGFMDVSPNVLRVMRARWLLRRDEILRAWNDLSVFAQDRLTDAFFRGQRPFVPPKGSPLDKLTQGTIASPITIPYDKDLHAIDLKSLIETLTTPGAEVPDKCPAPLEGPELPPPAPLEPPADAILEGEHDRACSHWKLNDPTALDVQKLPKDFRMCRGHWEKVKVAQGGAFRVFGPQRTYAGGRYVGEGRG